MRANSRVVRPARRCSPGDLILNTPFSPSPVASRETVVCSPVRTVPRIGLSQVTTRHWSFADDVHACRQAGLPALGLWRWKLHEYGLERGAELLRDSGIAASSLSFAGGFTGSDGYSYRDSLYDGRTAVKEAALLNAHCLVIVSGARAKHTRNHARRLVVDALKNMADMAGERGVSLALQPMRASEGVKCTFLNSLEDTLEIVQRANRGNVGLVFDQFQLADETNLAEQIPEIAPHIKLALLCDLRTTPEGPVRCVPGEGVLPTADWVRRLEAAGYRGTYEAHVPAAHVWDRPTDDVLQSCIGALRRLVLQQIARPEFAVP